jgi:DNA polymerase V
MARVIAARRLRTGDINGLIDIEARSARSIPFATATVAAGFPSPADGYIDRPLDFNELLISMDVALLGQRTGFEPGRLR